MSKYYNGNYLRELTVSTSLVLKGTLIHLNSVGSDYSTFVTEILKDNIEKFKI